MSVDLALKDARIAETANWRTLTLSIEWSVRKDPRPARPVVFGEQHPVFSLP